MKSSILSTLALATLASVASALSIPILGGGSPTSSGTGQLLGAIVTPGNHGALIDINGLVNVLGPSQCSANSVVGIQVGLHVGNLLDVCLCVEVLNILDTRRPCPKCGPNFNAICSSGKCGCECPTGFYSTKYGTCLPRSSCPPNMGLITSDSTGSHCACKSPYVCDNAGGCKLPASQKAKSNKSKKSKSSKSSKGKNSKNKRTGGALVSQQEELDSIHCPAGEQACAIGSGWECLDTTTSLDSCGGCMGQLGAENCLSIPGALAVSCVESKCQVSSCFPGFRFYKGHCVRTQH